VVEADEIRSSCEIERVEYVFLRWEDEGAGGRGAGGEYGCGCDIRSGLVESRLWVKRVFPVRSSSHTFANTRGHLDSNQKHSLCTTSARARFNLYATIYGELLLDLPCTARTYRYSVLSSSQSLLLYTTTCMEPRWRDPWSMAMLGMHCTPMRPRVTTYCLPDSFFLPPSKATGMPRASMTDHLNTTAGKQDIEYLAGFR
jgi:hypothetical protein